MQIWADIPGFPGYQASDLGEIRNRHGRVLKDRRAINGARRINVGKFTRMVHALVASAFLGSKPDGFFVKHRNRNKQDNRLSNLYYGRLREPHSLVGVTCSRGHSMAGASTWGSGKHRMCVDCAAGKPRVLELPEVL